jgi:hypothetical protein
MLGRPVRVVEQNALSQFEQLQTGATEMYKRLDRSSGGFMRSKLSLHLI